MSKKIFNTNINIAFKLINEKDLILIILNFDTTLYMTESLDHDRIYHDLQKRIEKLIKKQSVIKYFIDWEDWLNEDFNPLNNQYKNAYDKLEIKPVYIDFEKIVNNMIASDCDMKIYE